MHRSNASSVLLKKNPTAHGIGLFSEAVNSVPTAIYEHLEMAIKMPKGILPDSWSSAEKFGECFVFHNKIANHPPINNIIENRILFNDEVNSNSFIGLISLILLSELAMLDNI